MARKTELVVMKVPEEFKLLIDKKRIDEGFNNRERADFLRQLCEEEDPLAHLTGKTKRQGPELDEEGFFRGF